MFANVECKVSWLPEKATQLQILKNLDMSTKDSKTEQPCTLHGVSRFYSGLDFDYKITAPSGEVYFLGLESLLYETFNKWDKEELKIQQYTGIKDRDGKKIYFRDRLRFADKWEWYKGEWALKFMGKKGKELEKLKAEYEALPFEERVIESVEDYEWLLSSEIQSYWELCDG